MPPCPLYYTAWAFHWQKGAEPHIRDKRRYYAVGVHYAPGYPYIPSLRPGLQLEMIQRTPLLPVERKQFGYLYENLAGLAPSISVAMTCISVAETAAEKVLSLLRRCAHQWSGCPGHLADPTLVRHVYDVASIASRAPGELHLSRSIFAQLVVNDRAEFSGQNPEFDADPVNVLKRALVDANENGILRQCYNDTLLPLVYERNPPTFDEAFGVFAAVARELLDACPKAFPKA